MHYTAVADTDVGIYKKTNQDSLLIRHARCCGEKEVLMAAVCDGMGGLEKGELASAVVVRALAEWFDKELLAELLNPDMNVIGNKLSFVLKDTNIMIREHSAKYGFAMGTTCTVMLFVDNEYTCVHVGDTRAYQIIPSIRQLTTDQTYVAREISRGTMTEAQAKRDRNRNMLLQCVGVSEVLKPEMFCAGAEPGVYLLCSDGLRHEVSDVEMAQVILNGCAAPYAETDKVFMHADAKELIQRAKDRGERDNISVLLIRVE